MKYIFLFLVLVSFNMVGQSNFEIEKNDNLKKYKSCKVKCYFFPENHSCFQLNIFLKMDKAIFNC